MTEKNKSQKAKAETETALVPGAYRINPRTGSLTRIDRSYPHMFRNKEDRDHPQCGEVTNNFYG